MPPPFPVYLFDVDGTLVDSAPDICAAQIDLFKLHGREVTPAFLRRYIGFHLTDLFRDMGFPEEALESLIVQYRTIYWDRKHAATHPYPGVTEMLAVLGGRKSTATTKTTPTTRGLLEQLGLIQHFEHVQGTDGFPAKPEPDVILACLKALDVPPEECLLVGDSVADMEAGRRAGVRLCAVRWGYGDPEAMAKWNPDYWIDEPAELLSKDSSARSSRPV
jgi:phosphoglycolate phosphatase